MAKSTHKYQSGTRKRIRSYRITLRQLPDAVIITAFADKRVVSITHIAKRFESLRPLPRLIPAANTQRPLEIPLDNLADVYNLLKDISEEHLEIDIPSSIQFVKIIDIPDNFEVRYVWSDEIKGLQRQISHEAEYLGNGTFRNRSEHWFIKKTNHKDDQWLSRKTITGKDILTFIDRVLLHWTRKELPYYCDIQLSDTPLFEVTITGVTEDYIDLSVEHHVQIDPDLVKTIAGLSGYVLAGDTIHPGFLQQKILKQKIIHYSGWQAIYFVDKIYPEIKAWTHGKVSFKDFKTLSDDCQLVLKITQHENDSGIGFAKATPTFVCGDVEMDAKELSEKLGNRKKHIQLSAGWISVDNIYACGIHPWGRLYDGRRIETIAPLTPAEIFKRGSRRLDAAWHSVEFPKLRLPNKKNPVETAVEHFEFLRSWGIPGGIIGDDPVYIEAAGKFLLQFVENYPKSRILILAEREWAKKLNTRFKDTAAITVENVLSFVRKKNISDKKWTILFLWGMDCFLHIIGEHKTMLLSEISAQLVLGTIEAEESFSIGFERRLILDVFRLVGHYNDDLWQYCFRDLNKKLRRLPRPYRFQGGEMLGKPPVNDEIIYDIIDELPEPPPYIPVGISDTECGRLRRKQSLYFEMDEWANPHQYQYFQWMVELYDEALQFVNHVEPATSLVVYDDDYMKLYSAWSEEQRKFYFYWRNEVRNGNYIDTHLYYVFMVMLELLNNIGVKDAEDGYRQLYDLWFNYRNLDSTFAYNGIGWIGDYILVNRCQANFFEFMKESYEAGIPFENIDFVLFTYLRQQEKDIDLPVSLIKELVDYKIFDSRFYKKHANLMEQYLPQVIKGVNQYMTETTGLNIFQLFNPYKTEYAKTIFFEDMPYIGETGVCNIVEVLIYSTHKPFRLFLTDVVKYTENQLRQLKKQQGKLRVKDLEPEIQAVIDQIIFDSKDEIVPLPPKPKVKIDLSKVKKLMYESDEVRDMLITEDANIEQDEITTEIIESEVIEAPTEIYDDEITALRGKLEDHHLQVLKILITNQDPKMINQIATQNATMPELLMDTINEIALDIIGDILIDTSTIPPEIVEENLGMVREWVKS